MSTIPFPDQGAVFPDTNQQLLPAEASMQSIKEFLFDFIADKPTTAVHTNVWQLGMGLYHGGANTSPLRPLAYK